MYNITDICVGTFHEPGDKRLGRQYHRGYLLRYQEIGVRVIFSARIFIIECFRVGHRVKITFCVSHATSEDVYQIAQKQFSIDQNVASYA